MKKRFAIFGGVLLVVILGAGLWQVREAREPVHEGQKLSEWMERHLPSSAANPPYGSEGWKKAHEAIRNIGTNGIPTLLKMISATDNGFKRRFLKWASTQPRLHLRYRPAYQLNEEAEYAFEILGTNAVGAVPGLTKIYQDARSESSQRCTALALGHIGRGAEPALPALIQNFKHMNDQVRFYAVSAVMHINGDPAVVVSALRSVLRDSKVETRWNAIVGLSMYGRKAQAAVSDLVESRESAIQIGNNDLKKQVDVALWRIAPEKTARAIVVEKGTPIALNGVVTEAMDLALRGERRTLIKPGTAVPVARQTWDSDPRGRIELYRGARKGVEEGEEIFLGEFEVLGLPPPPESVHAYVIFGIAEGNVFICARDVNSNELLEVRRVR